MNNKNRPPAVTGKAASIGAEHTNYNAATDADATATALDLRRTGTGWLGTCPSCNYPNALSMTTHEGQMLWYCHACQDGKAVGQALRALVKFDTSIPCHPHPAKTAAAQNDSMPFILSLWQQSRPASGTAVSAYLRGRGLVGSIPETLRLLPACPHTPTGARYPTMLAAVSCYPSRKIIGIHRTFLKPDGTGKIDHPLAKMMLGNLKGGAVRLAPHGERIGLAEGIETALSVQQATGLPMWACLSTSGLQTVILPDDVREVIICADHDPPGLKAAYAAAQRIAELGKRVRIALPPKAGEDFNDVTHVWLMADYVSATHLYGARQASQETTQQHMPRILEEIEKQTLSPLKAAWQLQRAYSKYRETRLPEL